MILHRLFNVNNLQNTLTKLTNFMIASTIQLLMVPSKVILSGITQWQVSCPFDILKFPQFLTQSDHHTSQNLELMRE
jgi:hypothetical protein